MPRKHVIRWGILFAYMLLLAVILLVDQDGNITHLKNGLAQEILDHKLRAALWWPYGYWLAWALGITCWWVARGAIDRLASQAPLGALIGIAALSAWAVYQWAPLRPGGLSHAGIAQLRASPLVTMVGNMLRVMAIGGLVYPLCMRERWLHGAGISARIGLTMLILLAGYLWAVVLYVLPGGSGFWIE